jgi:hypothetical protein
MQGYAFLNGCQRRHYSIIARFITRKNLAKHCCLCYLSTFCGPEQEVQVSVRNSVVIMAFFMLLFSASHASAELYRWVDKDGQEFFTNERSKVPQEYQRTARLVKTDDNRVSIGGKPALPQSPTAEVKEHRDKNGRGEEWWHRRAESQRLELRKLEDDRDLLLKKEQDEEKKLNRSSGKKKKSSAAHDRKKMQLEKKIAQAKRRLEMDLPEEARKADAYPGWLRE